VSTHEEKRDAYQESLASRATENLEGSITRESALALIKDANRWSKAYAEARDELAGLKEQYQALLDATHEYVRVVNEHAEALADYAEDMDEDAAQIVTSLGFVGALNKGCLDPDEDTDDGTLARALDVLAASFPAISPDNGWHESAAHTPILRQLGACGLVSADEQWACIKDAGHEGPHGSDPATRPKVETRKMSGNAGQQPP